VRAAILHPGVAVADHLGARCNVLEPVRLGLSFSLRKNTVRSSKRCRPRVGLARVPRPRSALFRTGTSVYASSDASITEHYEQFARSCNADSTTYTTVFQQLKAPNSSTMFKRVLARAPTQATRVVQTTARPTTTSFAQTITPLAQPSRRSYHEKVLDHYNNPRNVGSMGKNEQGVGTGLVGAPACGDVMKIQIKVDPTNETITDVKFKTFGCGSAIASSSYLTELVKGMTLEQAGRIKNTEIAKELCLPPVKREWAG
jgi:iron-sulfur cluster assembly enzyme ISCU, mitochondrial